MAIFKRKLDELDAILFEGEDTDEIKEFFKFCDDKGTIMIGVQACTEYAVWKNRFPTHMMDIYTDIGNERRIDIHEFIVWQFEGGYIPWRKDDFLSCYALVSDKKFRYKRIDAGLTAEAVCFPERGDDIPDVFVDFFNKYRYEIGDEGLSIDEYITLYDEIIYQDSMLVFYVDKKEVKLETEEDFLRDYAEVMSRKGYIILTDLWRGGHGEGGMEYFAGVKGDPTIFSPDVQYTPIKKDAIFYESVEKAENAMKKLGETWEIVPYDSTETKGGA